MREESKSVLARETFEQGTTTQGARMGKRGRLPLVVEIKGSQAPQFTVT